MPANADNKAQDTKAPASPNAQQRLQTKEKLTVADIENTAAANSMLLTGDASHHKRIDAAIETAQQSGGTAEEVKAATVKALLAFKDEPLLSDKANARIVNELNNRGGYGEVLDFLQEREEKDEYLKRNTHFFDSTPIKEVRAKASYEYAAILQRSPEKIKKADSGEKRLESQKTPEELFAQAIEMSNALLADDNHNVEAWRTKTMALRDSGKAESREQIAEEFTKAFQNTGDYSMGIGAVNAALENGNMQGAKQLAEAAMYAAKSVGSEQTKQFWPVLAEAEAALLAGTDDQQRSAMAHLDKLLIPVDGKTSPLVNDEAKGRAIGRFKKIVSENPAAEKVLQPLLDRLAMKPEELQKIVPPQDEKIENEIAVFNKQTYSVREAVLPGGIVIPGTIAGGGTMPDIAIGPEDMRQFRELAKVPLERFVKSKFIQAKDLPRGVELEHSLIDIKDFNLRNKVVQELTRAAYGIDGQEDSNSPFRRLLEAVGKVQLDQSGITYLGHLEDDQRKAYEKLKEDKVEGERLYWKVREASGLSDDKRAALNKELTKNTALVALSGDGDLVDSATQLIALAEPQRTSSTATNISISAADGMGRSQQAANTAAGILVAAQQEEQRQAIMKMAEGITSVGKGLIDEGNKLIDQGRKEQAEASRYDIRVSEDYIMAPVEADRKKAIKTRDGKFVLAKPGELKKLKTPHANVQVHFNDGTHMIIDPYYSGREGTGGDFRMSSVESEIQKVQGTEKGNQGVQVLQATAGTIDAVECKRDGNGDLELDDHKHPIPVDNKVRKVPVTLVNTTAYGEDKRKTGAPDELRFFGHKTKDDLVEGWTSSQDVEARKAFQRHIVDNAHELGVKELLPEKDRLMARLLIDSRGRNYWNIPSPDSMPQHDPRMSHLNYIDSSPEALQKKLGEMGITDYNMAEIAAAEDQRRFQLLKQLTVTYEFEGSIALQADRLSKKMAAKDWTRDQQKEAYKAIGTLVSVKPQTANPLADHVFVQALEEKYGKSDDPFGDLLKDANQALAKPDNPLNSVKSSRKADGQAQFNGIIAQVEKSEAFNAIPPSAPKLDLLVSDALAVEGGMASLVKSQKVKVREPKTYDYITERLATHEAIVQLVSGYKIKDEHALKALVEVIQKTDAFQKLAKKPVGDEKQFRDEVKAVIDLVITAPDHKLDELETYKTGEQVVTVLIGGPATGKSTARNAMEKAMKKEGREIGTSVGPDEYKEMLADSRKLGMVFGDLTHQESLLVVDKIRKRLAEKAEQGMSPNYTVEKFGLQADYAKEIKATGAKISLVATFSDDLAVPVARNGARGDVSGRYVSTEGVLKESINTPKYLPATIKDAEIEFTLFNTNVKWGADPIKVAHKERGSNVLTITNTRSFNTFLQEAGAKKEAKSPDRVYDSKQKAETIIQGQYDSYAQNGITLQYLNDKKQVLATVEPVKVMKKVKDKETGVETEVEVTVGKINITPGKEREFEVAKHRPNVVEALAKKYAFTPDEAERFVTQKGTVDRHTLDQYSKAMKREIYETLQRIADGSMGTDIDRNTEQMMELQKKIEQLRLFHPKDQETAVLFSEGKNNYTISDMKKSIESAMGDSAPGDASEADISPETRLRQAALKYISMVKNIDTNAVVDLAGDRAGMSAAERVAERRAGKTDPLTEAANQV